MSRESTGLEEEGEGSERPAKGKISRAERSKEGVIGGTARVVRDVAGKARTPRGALSKENSTSSEKRRRKESREADTARKTGPQRKTSYTS